MPISVVCPACKARFSVSEKFAGKQGPCPKCKAPITIPDAPAEEVKVHGPEEFASGGKDAKGRPVLKPVARKDARLQSIPLLIGVGGTGLVFLAAWALRSVIAQQVPLRGLGLLLVGAPICVGGYGFLRNDELEPHRGMVLWIRALICGTIYALLWLGFWFVPASMLREAFNWVFIAPAFAAFGGATGWLSLDLDPASGFFHYCFYVLVTLVLGYAAGLPMPWAATLGLGAS